MAKGRGVISFTHYCLPDMDSYVVQMVSIWQLRTVPLGIVFPLRRTTQTELPDTA